MTAPVPPVARRVPLERRHHGDLVVDQYEWLRQKEEPEVIAHLEAENAYTDALLAPLAPLRERLFDEIRSRTKETDLSVPVREGAWWYFSRSYEGRQYGVHCRAPISGPDDWTPPSIAEGGPLEGEQVVLDGNIEAEGHDFFSLGSFDVSSDGRFLLFGTDVEGDERYTLRIRDLSTGEDLPDVVEGTGGGATFGADARFVFYPTVDESWRPDTIWRHTVGTDSTADEVVFSEPDERYWIGVGLTRSRRFLVIEIGSKITSESLLLDAEDPTGEFRSVWPRREGVEYEVDHAVVDGRDRLLIVHNDGALDFEIVEEPADLSLSPEERAAERRVLVPHTPGRRIEGVDAFARHVVVSYREAGATRLGLLIDGDGGARLEEIVFDEPLYDAGLAGNPEWEQPALRLAYTSFVTPSTVLTLDVATGERTVLKQQPVLGDYDPARYEQRREWAVAQDGTRIPLSLVWRKDAAAPDEAPAPLLLYGYGSYEASIDPGFSIARLSLLDRGVVFAIAHVRGGGEMGRSWYEEGKTLAKRTTFTDFVDSARHLVEAGFTTPERLVAQGGSAGGLLMGAVANLAPEAFAGILAQVPFVDALTSILDPSLPLTVIEWDEWGDPLHDPEVYAYMKSYSPYENVREGVAYPRILATTSLNDTRVLYVEPAKWVARLREVGAPALLKIEMTAGHGGVSGRYERWREVAFEYAWILDVLGLAEETSN
ncbi:S9 family peptidase [Rathayibacter sp. VKM Ac-2857]|uniref:S9 family peptidase n=1 Tax=Rathayibacter sp. VKM Ac-2857 TaxID=2739020 RepID=UPI00156779A8|nr:S9 family peptidase [Rathayibacter sp. VKM Ac-2857]NQX14647.1 S9 family peptidase [Rathayibacter sp. VKM Ac-2857]